MKRGVGTLLLWAAAAAGCADPVVGAECRPGFEPNAGRCVAVVRDAGATPDATVRDGDVADGGSAGRDGGLHDASTGWPDGAPADGGVADGGSAPVCDLGELECDGACVRPSTDAFHCGGCGMSCALAEVCAAGTCAAACEAPLATCDGVCVDLSSDPDNCGACGRTCSSGICVDSECAAATAGHLAVIGHDYRNSRRGMNRVAGNAVFLARGAPVRVLVYEGEAPLSAVRGVDRAIDQVAADTGRSWTKAVADAAEKVSLALAEADAFVVYSQRDTPDGDLVALGVRWATALRTFLERGGIVVLFDGAGSNDGSWQILDAAGLFAATGRVAVSGDDVRVVAPGDAVALSVPLTYRGETSTVRFETEEGTVVVAHDDGPVVVHRVFAR